MTEEMDVDKVLELLTDALKLQLRSSLHYTLFSASMPGYDVQGVAGKLGSSRAWSWRTRGSWSRRSRLWEASPRWTSRH